MKTLLERARAINKLLQTSTGNIVDFQEVARVLSENINASVYILEQSGKIIGYAALKDLTCDIMRDIAETKGGFPEDYNEMLMRINETHANYCQSKKLLILKSPAGLINKSGSGCPAVYRC